MVENESSLMFVLADLLGMRAGSICVSMISMIEGTPFYAGAPTREIYPETYEPDYFRKRIELASQIAIRATEILTAMDKN